MRTVAIVAFCALSFVCFSTFIRADDVQSTSFVGVLIPPGQDQDAIDYYKRISAKLGVNDTETDLRDLSALLAHFGFGALTGEQLEAPSPADLMHAFPNKQLLATRFFAPKIVDFNFQNANPIYPFNAGWRKLVRLAAQKNSKADTAGLAAAYILFNYVQKDPTASPFPDQQFKVESFNTQAIIVPKSFKKGSEDSAYFLDFDTRTNKYVIHHFLSAAFDTAPNPNNTHRNYYVPVACAECHGHDQEGGNPANGAPVNTGTFPFVTVNYLDSDHWYDMLSFGDFPSTKHGKFDVLFDGGLDHTSGQYKSAVDVMRSLNQGILQQNTDSARTDGNDAFRVKAVQKWLSVHQSNDGPIAPIDRALDLGNGARVWQRTAANQHLLELLDHYCFRCHSSVLYDVFDKQGVLDEKASMTRRVQLPPTNVLHMPQGRVLDQPTITDLVNSLKAVQ